MTGFPGGSCIYILYIFYSFVYIYIFLSSVYNCFTNRLRFIFSYALSIHRFLTTIISILLSRSKDLRDNYSLKAELPLTNVCRNDQLDIFCFKRRYKQINILYRAAYMLHKILLVNPQNNIDYLQLYHLKQRVPGWYCSKQFIIHSPNLFERPHSLKNNIGTRYVFQNNEVRATTSSRGRCSGSTSGRVRRKRHPIALGTKCTWLYAGRVYLYIKTKSRTKLRPINRTKERLLSIYEARLLPQRVITLRRNMSSESSQYSFHRVLHLDCAAIKCYCSMIDVKSIVIAVLDRFFTDRKADPTSCSRPKTTQR